VLKNFVAVEIKVYGAQTLMKNRYHFLVIVQSVTSNVMLERPKQPVALYPSTRATSYQNKKG
jgi:hypothetical protein